MLDPETTRINWINYVYRIVAPDLEVARLALSLACYPVYYAPSVFMCSQFFALVLTTAAVNALLDSRPLGLALPVVK